MNIGLAFHPFSFFSRVLEMCQVDASVVSEDASVTLSVPTATRLFLNAALPGKQAVYKDHTEGVIFCSIVRKKCRHYFSCTVTSESYIGYLYILEMQLQAENLVQVQYCAVHYDQLAEG